MANTVHGSPAPASDLVHAGRVRTIRFARFEDGTSPAKAFFDELRAGKRTESTAIRLLVKLRHIADNGHHPDFKEWEKGIMQLADGAFRLSCVERQQEGKRALLLVYGFEKHAKKTPREHENNLRRLCAKIP